MAGIGSDSSGAFNQITISGGTIIATGGINSVGIGNGARTANSIDPVVYAKTATSTGYTTLSSTNNAPSTDVIRLQTALASLGYYGGSLDGNYGSGTITAMKNWQAAKGLRVTGVASPAMQRTLYGHTSDAGSYSTLRPGDTGSDVQSLQFTMYELNYYDANITGVYDDYTTNAVYVFQRVQGLTCDGVAGPNTLRILYSSSAKPMQDEISYNKVRNLEKGEWKSH